MKSFFQKHLLLFGIFLMLTSVAKGQADGPYFLSGPETVCAGLCGAIFSIQSTQPGGLEAIVAYDWHLPNGSYTNFIGGQYYRDLCFSTGTGLNFLSVAITTADGNSYFIWYNFFTVTCNNPIEFTSDASQFCPAENIAPPPPPPVNGFTLTIDDADDVASGQQVCLDVTCNGFYNILGLQFSISYDPMALQFTSVTDLNLNGLSSASFGNPEPGKITMSWSDPNVSGTTRPDGTTLFRLCFTALSGSCASEVAFSNTPTVIEVLSGNLENVPFNGRPGHVQINGSSSTGNPNPPPPTCCEQVCANSKVRYTVSLGTDAFFFVDWYVIGSNSYESSNGGKTLEVEWNNSGTGTVKAIVGNRAIQRCVNILPVPESAFTTDPPPSGDTLKICQGQSVTFTNTTQNAESYLWQFGNERSTTELNPEYDWNTAGVYRMALIAYNECLCPDTSFLTVLVSPVVAPEITCRGTICEGTAVTYTTDADCGTFLWTVGPNGIITDGGGSADNFIAIDWAGGPEGFIQLQVENCATANYCPEPNRMRVPIISESAEISGPEQVCRAQLAQYAIPLFGGVEYAWTVSTMGNIQSGQGTNEITVQWANTFSTAPQWVAVSYYNCYLECGGADTIWVAIQPEFYAEGPIEVCLNDSRQYIAKRIGNNALVTCNWEVKAADGTVVWTSTTAGSSPTIPWVYGPGNFTVIARTTLPGNFCNAVFEVPVRVTGLPQPLNIIGQSTICPGLDYTYTTEGVLPGHQVQWWLTGQIENTHSLGATTSVEWAPAPPYKLVVRQYSPQSCASPLVELNLTPLPAISISGDTTICADETTSYSVPAFDRLDYTWTVTPADAGTILGELNSPSIEILWHKAGPATIGLAACGQNVSIPINVHPKPTPQVTHPAYLCPGETAAVQTNEAYASYTWHNETGAEVSADAVPSLPLGYYQLSVANNFGCTGNTQFNIEGYPSPSITISTPDNTGLCTGTPPPTLFALDTEEGYTYQWIRNGNPIAGATDIIYSTSLLGNYRVAVTDHNGCSALSDTLGLFQYCGAGPVGGFPGGGPPGVGFGSGGGGTPIECLNTLLQFDIQATPVCNVSNFFNLSTGYVPGSLVWDFGDPGSGAANNSTSENPSHTFSQAGFFPIYLFGEGQGPDPIVCLANGLARVRLVADFYFERACAGAAVNFFDASTYLPIETIASWSWDFDDPASGSNNNSTDKDPIHIYSTPGVYMVTLIVTATSGCSAEITKQVEVFPLPSVSFDLPIISCAATAVRFEADVAADATALQWNFGDPASGAADTSALSQPFHRYQTPGTYTARLDATSIYGCTSSFSQNLTITLNTLVGAITFISPICEGDSTLLTASPGGTSWAWSTGDTTATTWAQEEGVYSVVVGNANGCQYEPEDVLVRVIPAPNTTIRALHFNEAGLPGSYQYDSMSVCVGEDVFLEVIEQYNRTYLWSNGLAGSQIEFSQDRNSLLPIGEHEIFVTVTDIQTSCSNTIGPFRVIVRPLPALPVVSATPSGLICEGTLVTMSVNNPEVAVNYAWSSGVLGTVLETTLAGQYKATATNEWGCTNTSDPNTILAGPDINLIPSGCHTRCRPDTLCFPDVPGVSAYQWFFNSQPQGPVSATAPEIVVTQSGDYYLHMTTDAGCSLNSDPLTLELFDGFGSFRGQVYWDLNNNGSLDAGDSLLVNVPFILMDGNVPLDTAISQTGGQYSIPNILPASYGLQIDLDALPAGLVPDTLRIDTTLTGCDAEILINWRLSCPTATGSLALSACSGSTVDYNGTALAPGTVTDFTFSLSAGCDSIVTVTVNPLAPSTTSLALSACLGAFADYNGMALASGTVTDFTFTNAAGCDSIVTVTVNTLAPSTASVALSACPGTLADYNGTALAPGSVMDFTFTNAAGCDSIVTVTVNTLAPSTASLALSACPGTFADYNGTALAPGTVMDFTFINAAGCDSIVTVTVNTLATSATFFTLSACTGSFADYNGTALAPGSVTAFAYSNAVGCDSIVTVTVTSLESSSTFLTLNTCPGNAVNYNGEALAPGTITDFTFPNAAGCDSTVTVTVTAFVLPQFQVNSIASCPNQPSGTIEVSGQGLTGYALNGGVFQSTGLFETLAPGAYTLEVEDGNGCIQTSSLQIGALPDLQVQVANTILPCNAESITLEVFALSGDDGNLRFLWDNGETAAQRIVDTAGEYRLTAINNCDTLVQTITVAYEGNPDDTPIYVPNAFSPNGDGINDEFKVYSSSEVLVQSFELMIFDRWGNQLFHTKDVETGWNGFFRGRGQGQGVYTWWMQATVFHCGRVMAVKKKGDVTLVR